MNTINVISPYKYHGTWVFDDARVGLAHEPFVAGADTMSDRVVADIPDADRASHSCSPARPFQAINTGLTGGGTRLTAIGITQ